MDSSKIFQIEGEVYIPSNITHDKFHKEFLKWVERKNWSFNGLTRELGSKEDDEN